MSSSLPELIPLEYVVYNAKARYGPWCTMPYPGPTHVNGCPKFPKCMKERVDFKEFEKRRKYEWYAIVQSFYLKGHMKRLKDKYPVFTERQCRNVIWWQPKVNKKLKNKALKHTFPLMGDILLDVPEANGVDVFETMKLAGLRLEKSKPKMVHKIMLIGKREHGTS